MQKIIPPTHWLRTRPIAHRGLHSISKNCPENSLAAFDMACKKGFPIELDVRVSRDGKAVVFHDSNLLRLTGNNSKISNLLSNMFKNIHIQRTNEHVPLLDEVLELVNGRVPMLIEIKRNFLPGKLEDAVIKSLKQYKGEFAVLSFNPVALRYLHNRAPEFITGINIGKAEKYLFQTTFMNTFVKNFSSPHFISYSIRGKPPEISSSFFRQFNLPILAWTIGSEYDADKARKFADNIIFERFLPK